MDYEMLHKELMAYFEDTSRPLGDTKRGLLTLAQEAEDLADTICFEEDAE